MHYAGCTFEITAAGEWWAATEESDWPTDDRSRTSILASMDPDTGDRRQEELECLVEIAAGYYEELGVLGL